MRSIVNFIKENYTPSLSWDEKVMAQWISFYDKRRMISVIQKGKKIVGFAIARPLYSLMDYKKDYEYDYDGEICFVDLVLANSKEVKIELYLELLKRIGYKKWISFKRFKNGDNVRVYKLEQFMGKFCLGGT